jgi:hypothetical protein
MPESIHVHDTARTGKTHAVVLFNRRNESSDPYELNDLMPGQYLRHVPGVTLSFGYIGYRASTGLSATATRKLNAPAFQIVADVLQSTSA